jgi:hypothetical protein
MLNYNTIESVINFNRTPKTALAQQLGIPESTLRNRLERKNLTPDDVEQIAVFYSKPIAYFFDKEEKESPDVAQEGNDGYKIKRIECLECIGKQKEIDALKSALDAKDELLEMYRGKKGRECG